jgi:hypothetical protein
MASAIPVSFSIRHQFLTSIYTSNEIGKRKYKNWLGWQNESIQSKKNSQHKKSIHVVC